LLLPREMPASTATVTVAVPVHKRLTHLPAVLQVIAAQDYPHVQLLVSDNGTNGSLVLEAVRQHYHRPYTFRQNPATVPIVEHLNQLVAAATGDYFVLLCDDDEISPTFVSELVARIEGTPGAHVAMARPGVMDEGGNNRRTLEGYWPQQLPVNEFIRHWTTRSLRLASTVTHLARTDSIRACGGYADLPRGLYSDNLLVLKLALLGGAIAFGQTCTFTWRIDDASAGYSATYQEVAGSCHGFLALLETDPVIAAHGASRADWPVLRRLLQRQCGTWYFGRWFDRYRHRLTRSEWLRAALALPNLPGYYRQIGGGLLAAAKEDVKQRVPLLLALKRRWRNVS
jgi:glycosyltransferase involved in cell wall biosynthesis